MPLRLVRGNASLEELSVLVAVVAVLATASDDGDPDQAGHPAQAGGTHPQSAWGSPRRQVRLSAPHGRGGWRASALPR